MPNKFFPNKLKSWWQQRFKQDTLDWRSLSPHHPPLPFLSSNTVDESLNDSTPIQHHSNIILDSISNIHPSKVKNKPFHSLFPILEESETIITEEVRQETTQRKSPETSSTCSPVPSNIGDEERCKQRFVNMVLAAKQSHQSNPRPTEMSLIFDPHGNIDAVQMIIQGQSIQQKFNGNPQCIPPEVATSTEYKSEQAEVWILGIYLYKMLTGKYPFHASNHQQLLKRMLHTSFSLPNDLSEDAKDILRRMLAPDIITRASLDLIIYHPWLQPYRHLLVEQSSPIQQDTIPKVIKKKKRIKPFKQAVLFIFHGPFPPPKKPYQDLSHLGTRESVFARQRQL